MSRILILALNLLTVAATATAEMFPLPGPPNISESNGYRWSTVLGDTLYFHANNGCYGDELWKLDFLTGETSMMKDINPGPASSRPGPGSGFPAHFAPFKGHFYFAAQSPATSTSLWRSDGTAEGTVPFYDFKPGSPIRCLAAGDILYITVYNTSAGDPELWKSDGTPQGTVRVLSASGAVPDLAGATVLGNQLVYPFEDRTNGREMWRTDGTVAGTFLLTDAYEGSSSGNPLRAMPAGDKLYFITTSWTHQLWSTDGTVAGTKRVTQGDDIAHEAIILKGRAIYNTITPTSPWQVKITDGTAAGTRVLRTFSSSTGRDTVQLAGASSDLAFFLLFNVSSGAVLWKTDGTPAGTAQVKTLGSIETLVSRPFALENKLFMNVQTAQNGKELWVTDGTPAGTGMVKDIFPGTQHSDPYPILSARGFLYFTANDGVHGTELWKTDGTAAGTSMVRDLEWTSSRERPSNMSALGNNLLFCATDPATGRELWRYDAEAEQAGLVRDLLTGSQSAFSTDYLQQPFVLSGPYLYLVSYNGNPAKLWRTDGTNGGTVLLQNAVAQSSGFNFLTPFKDGLLFPANGQLWRTSGTPGTTFSLRASDRSPGVAVVPDTAIFTAPAGESRSAFYRTNGTAAGTTRAGPPGFLTALSGVLGTVNDTIFMLGAVNPEKTELWKTDGTAAGTSMVRDLTSVPGSSSHLLQVSVGNRIFFIKHPTQQTSELWVSDGSATGTIKLRNLVHDNFAPANNLTPAGNILYYTTGSGNSTELIRTDGTPAGTLLLRRFTENSFYPVTMLSPLGNGALFSVNTNALGNELWVTDGTIAGTKNLSDIMPGAGSSEPVFLGKHENLVYFAATDPAHGREIWVTDGNPDGTRLLKDTTPGTDSSFPFWVGAAGTRLLAMYEREPATGGAGIEEITPETAPEIAVLEGAAPPLTELIAGQETPVDFGMVRQSAPQTRVLTISNTGAGPLIVSNVSAPAGFSLLELPALPATVGGGQSLVFRLQLDATAPGQVDGTVTVESDDPDEAAFDFPVSGTVVTPEIAVRDGGPAAPEITDDQSGPMDFGTTRQAVPTVRSMRVENTGTAMLLISGVTVPAGYTLLNAPAFPAAVETGGALLFDIRLDATRPGTFAGEIVINSDDLDETDFNFPVTGTVVTPEIILRDGTAAGPELADGQTAVLDFGKNVQGTPRTRGFTIANTGTAELRVSGLAVPTGYTALNVPALPFLIGINQSVIFEVSLTTTGVGTHPGSVTVTSDDLDEASFDFPVAGEVFIPDPVSSVVSATTTLRRQTGLREQTIHVKNDTTATVPAYHIVIRGLPAGVTVNNASETRPDGSVVVYIRQEMPPHSSQDIVIEYYSATRSPEEVNPQLSTDVILNPPDLSVPAGEAGLTIDNVTRLEGGEMLIEFNSTPGKSYQIQFSADGTTWKESLPAIRAAANRTQWIDRGLPRTDKHPVLETSRFYRVRELPSAPPGLPAGP